MLTDYLKDPKRIFTALLAVLFLAISLAWLSSQFTNTIDWPSFSLVILISLAFLLLSWNSIKAEKPPKWLWALLIGAALLRIALGAFWFSALPAWGYDTPVQEAGYVMEDAFNRDLVAWKLAQSDLPLSVAFQDYSSRDQYGGLLMLSAGLYRYSGVSQHQALLIIILSATISAIGIIYLWAFAKGLWGAKVAKLAAWGLAIYPEAVLLGSSQMREAFSVTLTVAALYALWRYKRDTNTANFLFMLLPLALALPLSLPFAFSLLILLALVALPLYDWAFFSRPQYWLSALLIGIVAIFIFLGSSSADNLWIVQSAEWQAYISRSASGWVARQFDRMPLWGQIPFLMSYGVFRPLLPAAVFADGALIWRVIAVWRALGWTIVLAMLFYASFLVIKEKKLLKLPGILLATNWVFILIASFRGGGDLWDSPRYRSAFAGIQLALAAWALVRQAESRDPWLKRAIVGAGLMMAWFAPWYLRRYADFDWPVVELQHVIGLGLASAVLYAIWDWLSA